MKTKLLPSFLFGLAHFIFLSPGQAQQPASGTENIPPLKLKAQQGNAALAIKAFDTPPSLLAYTAFDVKNDDSLLAICRIASGLTQEEMKAACRHYAADRGSAGARYILFDPQLSPDGRYLLVKYGLGYLMSEYAMYLLNVETGILKKLEPQPRYTRTLWSPDSNFIAYVSGGDQHGSAADEGQYYGPLQLNILNWRTGEIHAVAVSDSLRESFNWIAPHTLVYGILPPEKARQLFEYRRLQTKTQAQRKQPTHSTKTSPGTVPASFLQPSVFEYSIDTRKNTVLFEDGYRPMPSPDGQWIAFIGSENRDNPSLLKFGWEYSPSGASLMLAKRDGTQRIALSPIQAYPDLQWHDNSHFFSLHQISENGHLKTELRKWNAHSRKYEIITIPGTPPQRDDASSSNRKQFETEHSFLVTSPPQKNNYLLSQFNRRDTKRHIFTLSILIQAVQAPHNFPTPLLQLDEMPDAKRDWYFQLDWHSSQ